jgi:hypothetical protein
MVKRLTIAMVMLGTLVVSSFTFNSDADAQWVRRGWYGTRTPYYSYYAPPTYNYYYTPRYFGRYNTPYRYYYSAPYAAPYYTARPGYQLYIR